MHTRKVGGLIFSLTVIAIINYKQDYLRLQSKRTDGLMELRISDLTSRPEKQTNKQTPTQQPVTIYVFNTPV